MKRKSYTLKIFAILMILVTFTMSINVNSYAIDLEEKGKIEITGVETGLKVSAYNLTKVNYDFDNDEPIEPPYEWEESVKQFLQGTQGEDPDYSTYVDPEVFAEKVGNKSEDARKFYDTIAAAIRNGEITLTPKTVESTEAEKVEITDLDMGTYLVLIENGYYVYQASVVNLTPEYDTENEPHGWKISQAVVEIKSSEPTITKTVDEDNVATSSKLSYTITADLPKFPENSLSKNYYISDNIPAGMKLVTGSVQVYGIVAGDERTLIQPSNYELTTSGAKRPDKSQAPVSFSVNFNNLKALETYTKVVVTYNVEFDESALSSVVTGSTGNTNVAYLDYSNNPYEEESFNVKSSSEQVYTYQATISKIAKKSTPEEADVLLEGAEFTLYSDVSEETAVKFKLVDGVYYVSDALDATELLVVGDTASGNKGKLTLKGLKAGTYYLREKKAPEGYNEQADHTEVVVGNTLDGKDGNVELKIENHKGFQLPVTGGMGTIIFTAVGTLLIGIGIILVVVALSKKKKAKVVTNDQNTNPTDDVK